MKKVVSRFAPSPTGYMHIGNLRTCLYAYLIAKHSDGKFILRIEDTDRNRFVPNSEQVILDTLHACNINYDEGPDVGGSHGPYRQSERLDIYMEYAKLLVASGKAYYCFCSDEEKTVEPGEFSMHHCNCSKLSNAEVEQKLKTQPWVIRFKSPNDDGSTTYHDNVFGDITVSHKEMYDIVLIKSDGYPTYNFCHIIDDHLMGVTHVLRGNEYLMTTALYTLIYKAFGWELPEYYHLPIIMAQDKDSGKISRFSKRHGAVSFKDLVELGYLPEALINYIALLGWHLSSSDEEFFTLDELIKVFDAKDIRKSSAVFDYEKLKWMNAKYISNLSLKEFGERAKPFIDSALTHDVDNFDAMLKLVQPRVQILSEIPEKIEFFNALPDFDINLLANDKKKTTLESAKKILTATIKTLDGVGEWKNDALFEALNSMATDLGEKAMSIMWVIRLAVSGSLVTVGGATEIMEVLGKVESKNRILATLNRL